MAREHKIEIKPEKGLNYNFLVQCSCAWQGRYETEGQAKEGAKGHKIANGVS